ncbi:hypothetical protein ACWT_6631 [Actinoplanes sp. SE50]|uniref:hypothetical protein n=1 Tax=unclassified Actinoplanes TaxID=2626549 RepID=UPI00023EC883|nr:MULTISPECIES: hypothetical protein [unclassified Actinoplanes]AEV87643.1 hypothetical protein ACPL_6761 [Actinoplanes sp. SE50/110]ATO86046.1 hypothetical protein ACWT_6631 [Actinoplanes sp. SE50]SLM03460.1 hypothetical protein ACSP50_6749 [Actinoplanes sp. SE50/110]
MNFVKRVASLDDRAVGSLVLGVAGLFFFNIVFGPTAIALGAITARRHGSGSPSRNAGLIGVALGIADLVVLAALMATQLRHGSVTWH